MSPSYKHFLSALGVIALCILGTGSAKEEHDPNAWKTESDPLGAYCMAQQFVEDRLKSPSTAEYPYSKGRVTVLGDRTYRIDSYVDSQNGFGGTVRASFVAKVKQVGDTKWELVSLEISE